jgi:hypothetical protein
MSLKPEFFFAMYGLAHRNWYQRESYGVNIFNREGIYDFLKWKDTDKERGKV